MRPISLVSCALALMSFGTAAWAEGPRNYISPFCGSGPFAGPYIGAAVGYGNQRATITDQFIGDKFRDRDGSVTFGGYAGYNTQCNNLVLGIETDFNYLNTSPSADNGGLTSSIDWFGTLRARAGVVIHDTTLLYATGGLAYANVDHTFFDPNVAGVFGPFSQSNSSTKTGWTLGGGLEHLHDDRWLFRAEAFFVDLGSKTISYVDPAGCVVCTARAKWDDEFWVARLGVTYKFGHREEVVPLK